MKSNKQTKFARDMQSAQVEFDRFMALSDEDKTRDAEATAHIPMSEWKPVSKAEWELLQSTGVGSARPGRPRAGRGAKPVSITIERGLLEEADKYARALGITRAQLVAQSLRLAMKKRIGSVSRAKAS